MECFVEIISIFIFLIFIQFINNLFPQPFPLKNNLIIVESL